LEVGLKLRPRIDAHQWTELAGVVGAVVLAMVVNFLGARHFVRWDWTADRRWTLSPATLETLGGLEQTVDAYVIAAPGDPLEPGLRELLGSYVAASRRLDVHFIDPDRDTVQLVDLQRRFGLQAGQAEDGRVAADAIVIVTSRDKHWFLTPSDLYEQSDDVHAEPREERALTQAIRSVVGGEKAKLCFTVGHGELSLDPVKDEREWLGELRDLLQKNNYDLASVDTTAPGNHEPFAGCNVVVVAGPLAPFGADEANRLRTWVLEGGSLFAALGPIDPGAAGSAGDAGLAGVLGPFGIAADDDVVEEVDPAAAIADTHGEGFIAAAKPHAVMASLALGSDAHPPKVAVFFTRSLRHVAPPGASPASDLLASSPAAYGKTNVAGAAGWNESPPREPGDLPGPLTIAMASERPHPSPQTEHGARAVVVGTRFVFAEENWRQPRAMHGAAFFVDSAISWLAARQAVVDVPERGQVAAGVQVSESGREEVRRYVVLLMPLAAVFLGIAVWGWRKSTEDKPFVRSSS
jgi:hypothetical protein